MDSSRILCIKPKNSRVQSGGLHLTQKVDYALFLLSVLARHTKEGYPSIATIARDSHLSFSFLQKVANMLKRAGYIRSHRGKDGGYSLAKKPESIRVKDIIESLEGRLQTSHCSADEKNHACPRKSFCAIREGFHRMNKEISDVYLSKTLSDFLS
ncbi:Rrf2 family transcriptional regulator [Candidatus Uhrbacteria bacterium]|nr:Rrf2 family transcriptional regulator [Candidatus Uhrbacteria bacterium]